MPDGPDPRYSKIKVAPGLYLAISDDGTRLFSLSKYEEDGSAFREDDQGRTHVIRGDHWIVRLLIADRTDGYPEIASRPVAERDRLGVIVRVNEDEVDEGHWRDISNLHETLTDAWHTAVFQAESWLEDRDGRGDDYPYRNG